MIKSPIRISGRSFRNTLSFRGIFGYTVEIVGWKLEHEGELKEESRERDLDEWRNGNGRTLEYGTNKIQEKCSFLRERVNVVECCYCV